MSNSKGKSRRNAFMNLFAALLCVPRTLRFSSYSVISSTVGLICFLKNPHLREKVAMASSSADSAWNFMMP